MLNMLSIGTAIIFWMDEIDQQKSESSEVGDLLSFIGHPCLVNVIRGCCKVNDETSNENVAIVGKGLVAFASDNDECDLELLKWVVDHQPNWSTLNWVTLAKENVISEKCFWYLLACSYFPVAALTKFWETQQNQVSLFQHVADYSIENIPILEMTTWKESVLSDWIKLDNKTDANAATDSTKSTLDLLLSFKEVGQLYISVYFTYTDYYTISYCNPNESQEKLNVMLVHAVVGQYLRNIEYWMLRKCDERKNVLRSFETFLDYLGQSTVDNVDEISADTNFCLLIGGESQTLLLLRKQVIVIKFLWYWQTV